MQCCRKIRHENHKPAVLIQRAAVSIMANIAEGFDRHTNKEFIQQLYTRCTKISSLLNGFIRYLRNSHRKH
jgi:hypothetical protein